MLAELRRRGRRLAIATHGGERYISALSLRLGYDRLFDRVFFHGFEGLTSKADMARRALLELGPGTGLFVGDRRADLDAARAASIPFVGCSYGYAADGELRGADALASSPAELARLLLDPGR
jgi:phosphoglycolate phosphatase-like HAD superfamily hydrolase